MNWNDLQSYILENRDKMDRPFIRKDKVWKEIQSEIKLSGNKSKVIWWKPLSGVAAAVLLGLLAVWSLQEYRQLTALSSEMATSVRFYENSELRLIKSMNSQNLNVSPDIQADLNDIDQTQKVLKKALYHAPESRKEWIYSALIETYELKIQLLEKIIYYDQMEQINTKKDGSTL